jgi:hypothetical protein
MAGKLMLSRYDLSIALLNGSTPLFFRQPQEPVIPYPAQLLLAPDEEMYCLANHGLLQQLDASLVTACQVMRRFCVMVNRGTQAHQVFDRDIVHETMTSVMYRLLHTNFASGSIDRAVQLGLLAFSYHIFIQWHGIKLAYQHCYETYRLCIQSPLLAHSVSPRPMLWLLMIGAISLFDVPNDAWLRASLRAYISICHVETWEEMQAMLESFMWVPVLDEQLGRQIYDELSCGI